MPIPQISDIEAYKPFNEVLVSESCASSDSTEDTQIESGRFDTEPSCESLLSLLDDKNRTIANLQNQIKNQKIQLQYYMSNRLSSTKINEFAGSCSANATEESMPLNMAMNKFYNQIGYKTKLCDLYDRMRTVDRRIVESLQDQEFILRKIINKLCEFLKQQTCEREVSFKTKFACFIGDPMQIQLFDGLVDATVNLRKSLDCFKICCDKLLTVEEERNVIVDQVYSMPAEQRMNCNYLIGIQMEKMQLENEIKRMLKHQSSGSKRVKELNVIESTLANLQYQLKCSYAEKDESRISQMLRKVGSEAKLLLAMAQEQRRRYELEMSRRSAEPLSRAVACVRLAVDTTTPSRTQLVANGIASPEEHRAWEMIKNQVERFRSRLNAEFSEKLHSKSVELDNIKNKWKEVVLENSELKLKYQSLKEELREAHSDHEMNLKKILQERDTYKSQVEDLETIREAYAQLVDRRPNSNKVEREFLKQLDEKDKRIYDFEGENVSLRKEIQTMKKTMKEQLDQIDILNRLLKLLKPEEARARKQDTTTPYPTTKNTQLSADDKVPQSKTEPSGLVAAPDASVEQEIISVETSGNPPQPNLLALPGPQSFFGKKPSEVSERTKQRIVNFTENESLVQDSLTCLKIYSKGKGRGTGLVEAVIKTNSFIRGDFRVDDPSKFSLEFKCKDSKEIVAADIKKIDEYDLHKDCSRETLPVVCSPRRKRR